MNELSEYYTRVNQALLSAIPVNAKRILEIGCGSGALGTFYKSEKNNSCEYWGVEYVEDAAKAASKNLNTVINGSIEDEEVYKKLPKDHFDVLVFGDVLEHLREPWDVLRRLTENMRPGAICVACIPNILHWTIFKNMLGGNWKYEDSGLMDRTHLRFFSRKSMVELFNGNGWRTVEQQPRYNLTPEKQRVVNELMGLRQRLGVVDKVEESDFLALQWIVKAEVQKAAPKLNAQSRLKINYCFFVREFFDIRTELPANDLAKLDGVEVLKSHRELPLGEMRAFPGPRIIVMQRPKITDIDKWFAMMALIREADCLPIYDVDDHPALLEAIGIQNSNRLLLARSMPAIQTSTDDLAQFYKEQNPNVVVFANSCHKLDLFPPERSGPVKIFFGAFNRHGYSAEIARKISPVLERYNAAAHVISDKAFFEGLTIPNKVFEPALEYEQYLNRMRECDILLTPLQGSAGEEYKSDVKYIEASALGLATIASRVVYGKTIQDAENGLIADSLDDWPARLEHVLSSPEERRRIAYNAWDYVRRNRLFAMDAPWRVQWYLDQWNNRKSLWEQVDQRVPEFKDFCQSRSSR